MIDIADFQRRMVEAREYTKVAVRGYRAGRLLSSGPRRVQSGRLAPRPYWSDRRLLDSATVSARSRLCRLSMTWFSLRLRIPRRIGAISPPRQEIFAYLDEVRARVFTFLERGDWPDSHSLLGEGRILNMLLQHEEQHTETILLILNLLAARRFDDGRREDVLRPSRAAPESASASRPNEHGPYPRRSLLHGQRRQRVHAGQ